MFFSRQESFSESTVTTTITIIVIVCLVLVAIVILAVILRERQVRKVRQMPFLKKIAGHWSFLGGGR